VNEMVISQVQARRKDLARLKSKLRMLDGMLAGYPSYDDALEALKAADQSLLTCQVILEEARDAARKARKAAK